MPYVEEVCVAGDTIEVCKYYSYRAHVKGEKREKKSKPTTEAQKRVNQRKAEKELRRLMNANFKPGDSLVRLDFSKQNFPEGSIDMQDMMKKAIRKLRASMKKLGKDFKYIYVKEMGKRGGRHIHMIMSKVDTDILMNAWPYGGIHVDPLITREYGKIASYFIKYALRTEDTEGMLIGKRWYASRNIEKPKVTKKIITANKFRERAKQVEGYELDKDSECRGISEVTGYAWYSYTLLRVAKGDGG